MNIFVLNEDPKQAARDMCNKHVVKMIVETAQILCTVSHLKGTSLTYKPTHAKHPCVLWTLSSVNNAKWLFEHGQELLREYTRRYGKIHATTRVFEEIECRWTDVWETIGDATTHTEFVQCMPEHYKHIDPIEAYRQFYKGDKAKFAKWEPKTNVPDWWNL